MRIKSWLDHAKAWMSRNGLFHQSKRNWTPANDIGVLGEDLAAAYLSRLGYEILKRNFKRTWGEIDLVARDGNTIVYIEVKTRRSRSAQPELAVNHSKQQQLIKLARSFASQYKVLHHKSRFDIVAINDPKSDQPIVRHFKSAFRAHGTSAVFSRDH